MSDRQVAFIMRRRATYRHWHDELGRYGAMAKRAIVAWQTIEDWCTQHHAGIRATLRHACAESCLLHDPTITR